VLNSLDECYRKELLRRVEPSLEKARRSLQQSRVWQDEARKSLAAGAFRSAMVSSYNGYFHAARAILYRDGLREKSHLCIELYLSSYVTKGVLEPPWIAQFSRMRSARHMDLYSFTAAPSREEVESALRGAEAFLARIEALLAATGTGE
jgi:uncharacterized protein (UPF0332 family)